MKYQDINSLDCLKITIRWEVFTTDDGNLAVGLYRLYVDPRLRRQGLARLLLSTAIKEVEKQHPDKKIYIVPDPYDEGGPDKEQLRRFYQSFPELTVVNEWP